MIERMVDFLNELLEQDRETVSKIFMDMGVEARQSDIEHPTIQVRNDYVLTLMGIINGLVIADNKCIGMHIRDSDHGIYTTLIDHFAIMILNE